LIFVEPPGPSILIGAEDGTSDPDKRALISDDETGAISFPSLGAY